MGSSVPATECKEGFIERRLRFLGENPIYKKYSSNNSRFVGFCNLVVVVFGHFDNFANFPRKYLKYLNY